MIVVKKTLVRLQQHDCPAPTTLDLSPIDVTARNRAMPMAWYYGETLDPDQLLVSLEKVLAAKH